MDLTIFSHLPQDIINYILIFDNRIKYRKGVYIDIIPRDDKRFNILSTLAFYKNTNMIVLNNNYSFLITIQQETVTYTFSKRVKLNLFKNILFIRN